MNWSEPIAWLDMTDLQLCLLMWRGEKSVTKTIVV